MKPFINDLAKRVVKPQKKTIIKRKNNSLTIINKDFRFYKTNFLKNTKKIIKRRLNSIKEPKNVQKKSSNSKLYFNTKISSKDNNLKTLNSRVIQNNNITPTKKTKIKIIKKKDHHCQRNYSCINNMENDKSLNTKLTKEKKYSNNLNLSTGLSNGTEDKDKEYGKNQIDCRENDRNVNINNFNYNADSHSNKFENILFEEKMSNINNFYYETISKEDSNDNDDKIILNCDNYCLLTFGNSFSYSNSQKRKTNRKFLNNDNKKSNNKQNDVDLDKLNDNSYVNKLKLENETLKKELEESAQQISFLMHQIKDLKDNTYLPTKKPRKKNIHRNISVKENKTKEIKDTKLKNLLLKKHKLNNDETNINKKITKSNSIIINSKKNKNNNKTNIHKKIYSMKNSVNVL